MTHTNDPPSVRETKPPPPSCTSWSAVSILRNALTDLTQPGKATIPGLDALRTLAILLVFSGHAYQSFTDSTHVDVGIGKFPLFYFGWTGVDLFFVLSGYLIGRQLWRELASTSTIKIGRFLVRRGMRIWPYYYCFVIAMIVFRHPDAWRDFWPDFVFLSNYFPSGISGGWSLSTEEQFYVLVPLGLLLARNLLPLKRMWIPLIGLLLLLPCLRAIAVATHETLGHGAKALFYITYAPIHTHSDGLVVGLLIAWLSVARPSILRAMRFKENVRVPAVVVVVGLALRSVNPDLFAFSGLAMVYGGATLFVLRDMSVLTALTRARIFHILSRLSYAMYLNHFIVLDSILPRVVSIGSIFAANIVGFLATYTVVLLVSVLTAAATFVIIESPFLQIRDAWLRAGQQHSH